MLSGQIVITRSNFASEYLDFRRNENGLVDTLNLDPGVPRIVNETETKDGITLGWENELRLGSLGFESDLSRTTGQTDFEASLVGQHLKVLQRLANQFAQ